MRWAAAERPSDLKHTSTATIALQAVLGLQDAILQHQTDNAGSLCQARLHEELTAFYVQKLGLSTDLGRRVDLNSGVGGRDALASVLTTKQLRPSITQYIVSTGK